jgi:hypothetical protein
VALNILTDDCNFGYITKLKQGVCHTVALPFTLKKYLKAKEEVRKLKCFSMQKYNPQKIL